MTTLDQLLDIDDALVSDANPARDDGPLDFERCARLHNYLVAYAFLASSGRNVPELNIDELLSRPSFFERDHYGSDTPRERLIPEIISFLESIIMPNEGFFFWVMGVEMSPTDEYFFLEEKDDNLGDKERFVTIYDTYYELGPHTVGLVYDQQRHRAAIPFTLENIDMSPVEEHLDMWYPLETILSNWIHMVRIGKVTAGPIDAPLPGCRLGIWRWHAYSDAQVDSAVAAMDQLTAVIEARMPSINSNDHSPPLFSDAQLDMASIPEHCFIRSFLTRVRTPRFKNIAPGLEVPHHCPSFVARQKFTGLPRHNEEGMIVPSVLLFTAPDHNVPFNEEIRWKFFTANDPVPYTNQPIPVGLYSCSVRRGQPDIAEDGFYLLLPDCPHERQARRSDGSLVDRNSLTQLFQHGGYYPFGGESRPQRLERLLNKWRELVESGLWTVGEDGVEGNIDQFQDADLGAWRDYWIPPGW